MPTFLEEVLKRRTEFNRTEDAAARAIQRELIILTQVILKEINSIEDFVSDPALGRKRSRLRFMLEDINKNIRETIEVTKNKVEEQRVNAFARGIDDMALSVDNATAGQVTLSTGPKFQQIFRKAAEESAKRKVLGASANAQINKIGTRLKNEVQRHITRAVLNGEPIPQTAKKIRDTAGISQRAATRVARTNLNASYNDAHRAVYESHDDIFKGYRWQSTFDSRTSSICAKLHGTLFPLGSKPPGPPAHPNCRSVIVGEFKDEELNKELLKGNRRVRNAETGQNELVSARKTFDGYLRDQPADAQRQITGSKLKHQLWRDRKVDFDDIVGPDLVRRNDHDVLQIAWAKNPDDSKVTKLAEERGIKKLSLQEIRSQNIKKEKRADHSLGKHPRETEYANRRRRSIDLRKEEKLKDMRDKRIKQAERARDKETEA